jgi:hypothetical protein
MSEIAEVVERLERSLHGGFLPSFRKRVSLNAREYLDEQLSWQDLRDLAQELLDLQEEAKQDLLDPVKGSSEGLEPSTDASSEDVSVEAEGSPYLGDYETARAQAIAEYSALVADQHPEVVKFRRGYLNDKTLAPEQVEEILADSAPSKEAVYASRENLLTPEQVFDLLDSPAAWFFPLGWFIGWQIPVIGHTAQVVGNYDPGIDKPDVDHRATVRVDPTGITRRVRYAHPDSPLSDESMEVYRTCKIRNEVLIAPGEEPLRYLDRDGIKEKLWVWPTSVLDHLREVGDKLASSYGWTEEAAVWFVLTGETPEIKPLDVRARVRSNVYAPPQRWITLNVMPWVPAETVKSAYRHMQKQMLKGKTPKKSEREDHLKILRVARFVWEQLRLGTTNEKQRWVDLSERWNQIFSDRRFGTSRDFRTYFERGAKKALESPGFKVPEHTPSTAEKKKALETRERLIRALRSHA